MSAPTCADSRPVNPPPLATEVVNPFNAGTVDQPFSIGGLLVRTVTGSALRHGCAPFSKLESGKYRYYRQADTFINRVYKCDGTEIRTDRWNSVRVVRGGNRTWPPGSCGSDTTTYPETAPAPPDCDGDLSYVDTEEPEFSDELTRAEVEAAAHAAAVDGQTDSGWPSTPAAWLNSRAIYSSSTVPDGNWSPAAVLAGADARRVAAPGDLDRRVTFTTIYWRLVGRASPVQIKFERVAKKAGVETSRTTVTKTLSPDNDFEDSYAFEAGTDEVISAENLCITPLG